MSKNCQLGVWVSDGVSISILPLGWNFFSNFKRMTPMDNVKRWTAKKKNKTPSFEFHPNNKKIIALNNRNLVFMIGFPGFNF